MPPNKAAPGKKGGEELDFSDVDTLPSVRECNIQILYSKFKSNAVRAKVADHLAANLPERIKTLTRAEIIEYGKAKEIIDAEAGPDVPPKDGGLTYEQMLAQSAADKLYELKVSQRRAKKEQLESGRGTPAEGEERKTPAEEAVEEKIDYIVNFTDYPTTAAESLALSQYGQSVHCLYEICQVQETNEGAAPPDLKAAADVAVGCDGGEDDDSMQVADIADHRLNELKAAIKRSAKNAPIRQTAILKVPFCDVELVELKDTEDGEPATNTLTAEQSFCRAFVTESLENYTQLHLNYQLFRELVDLHQLMPDKAVMSELSQLKKELKSLDIMMIELGEGLAHLEDQQLTEEQKEQMGEEQAAEHEKVLTEQIGEVQGQIDTTTAEIERNKERTAELATEATRSLDEENIRKPDYFSDVIYKNDFLPSKQSMNTVSSIVSAMVSQIAADNQFTMREDPASTEPETLDDIFDQYEEEIAYETNLKEREPEEKEIVFEDLKGKLNPDFNVFETYDTSSIPLQTLPVNCLDDYKDRAMQIASREKAAARHLQLPGCDRYMMPEVPQKSERLRALENPQFYPFSTLPIEDAERMMQLREFSNMMKSLGATETAQGAGGKDKLAKYKVFERQYDEYLEPDNFRQVLQTALLKDPDVAVQYYPRTDQLLLLLYNKVNGSKRHSENKEKPHGTRTWKATDRIMPDFQAFIDNFAPTAIQQDPEYNPTTELDPPQKLILAPDMLPASLLDIDRERIATISQNLNQYFPDDNSILTSEEYEVGGVQRTRSVAIKDSQTFGFHIDNTEHLPTAQQKGLFSMKSVGSNQFWLNFSDKESKLLVETIEIQRNTREMVEVLPPEKTDEELKAEQEAAAAAAAQAKPGAKKDVKQSQETIDEKPPEPIYEEAPPDFLDLQYNDSELGEASRGPCSTVTLKNGLMVSHLADGKIFQILEDSINGDNEEREVDRMFLPKGVVVRHFANQNCQVLYPKGEVANFDRSTLTWTMTNAKGLRRETCHGANKDLPPINCLKQSDPQTKIVTVMRADKVMLIEYANGALYCQHADGTQVFSEAGGSEIRVEKKGFAPVSYARVAKAEDTDEWLECDAIRSLDGWVTTCSLPDLCKVKTVKFFKDTDNIDRVVTKHIYLREDYSTFIIDEDGDFKVITTTARSAINNEYDRTRLGNDTEFLKQLILPPSQMTPGVFSGRLCEDPEQIHLSVADSDRPFIYSINGYNKLEKRNNDNFDKNEDWQPFDLQREYDPEIEIINNARNPFSKFFAFPRLFIVQPDSSGLELLSQDQLDEIVKNSQNRQDTLTTSRVEQVEKAQMNSIQVMTKVTSLQEAELNNNEISGKLQLPEYAEPYVISMVDGEQLKKMKPLQDQYQMRNISEYSAFDPIKQMSFNDDFQRFTEWKVSQVRYDTEFGIAHHAPKDQEIDWDEVEDNEYYAKKINNKIYKERALQRQPFDRSMFKGNFEKVWNTDNDIVTFRKKNTMVAKEEAEIRRAEEAEARKKQRLKEEGEQKRQEEELTLKRLSMRERAKVYVDQKLDAFAQMKNTPSFSESYHTSRAGMEYHAANPVKPPSEEVLMRMSQRINRSLQNTDKQGGQSIFDANSPRSGTQAEQPGQQKDNPIVALEPEDQFKQSSVDKSKKMTSLSKQTGPEEFEGSPTMKGPTKSLYMQEKQYLKQLEQEKILKAEEHHVIKTKDFDVYGALRQEKPQVKSTAKSNVASELNEKFITTECITDRRIKISSMANRQYMNAPSVQDVRKQGQHQMIMSAINKKQTFSELINQANSMVTSVLHDNMKRSVNIMPSIVRFGTVALGADCQMTVTIKNEDSLSQRIHIKPLQDKRLIVKQESYGPIAPGMTRKVLVTLELGDKAESGDIREEVQIVTKSDVFKLKVEASIVSAQELEKLQAENTDGKPVTNSRVRMRLRESIDQGNKMAAGSLGQVPEMNEEQLRAGMDIDEIQDSKDIPVEDLSAQSFH